MSVHRLSHQRSQRSRGIVANGELLRFLRSSMDMSQAELAWTLGYSERTVRNAEQGRRVDLSFLHTAAAYFVVPKTTLIENVSRESNGVLPCLWELVVSRLDLAGFPRVARKYVAADAILHCDQGEIAGGDPIIDHLATRLKARLADLSAIHFIAPERTESPSPSFAACRWIVFSYAEGWDAPQKIGAMTSATQSRGKLLEIWEYWSSDVHTLYQPEGSSHADGSHGSVKRSEAAP